MSGVDNPNAFPRIAHGQDSGMSLRDWFAGQALIGLLSGQFRDAGHYNLGALPQEAFYIADAMLGRRAK